MTRNPPGWGSPPVAGTRGAAEPRRKPPRLRVGAKLLVTDGRRVLLVRERRRDGSTFWTLPGGGVDPDESLSAGLRREIHEELGCGCAVGRPVSTCTYRHTSLSDTETRYAVFTGRLRSPPSPNPEEGVTDCAWFGPGRLPASLLDPFRRVVSGLASGSGRPFANLTTPDEHATGRPDSRPEAVPDGPDRTR